MQFSFTLFISSSSELITLSLLFFCFRAVFAVIGGVVVALAVAVGVVARRWMERERAWRRRLEEEDPRRERVQAERVEENLYEELPGEKKE